MHGFAISAYGWRADVLTDCAETCAVLDRYLLPWLPRTVPGQDAADAVFQLERSGGEFQLVTRGEVIARSPLLEAVIPALQSWIDDAVVHRVTGAVPLHSGTVTWNGAALLLPGSSFSGKSTLVAALVRRGCIYFSDECALIDSNGRVHPYPRALMLRDGRPSQQAVLASEWNAETGTAPAPVRLILEVRYESGAAWNVRPIQQSDMVLTLLKHTPRELAGEPDILATLACLASGAACYTGVRGETEAAVGPILELLGGTI